MRTVRVAASVLEGGRRTGEGDISERAATKAFGIAGVGPEDINVMEVHDATAFGELAVMEALGFCPRGEGGVGKSGGYVKA